MSQNPIPARVVHPGRILKRELDARGWTQKDLASIMGRPPQMISEIVNGTKQITAETALELGQALDVPPEFWTNLEANYQLYLARRAESDRQEKEIARKSLLYGLAPVSELLKRSWIQAAETVDDLESEVFAFLGVSSPDEVPSLAVRLRASAARGPEASAQIAWVKRVEFLASAQQLVRFDAARLEQAIPDLLACALHPEDVARVPPLLTSLGVHLVLVPHLPKTFLDGAAFYLNNQPVVALTLRYDRIDAFWFTLMHELAHIVKGHPGVYLDDLEAQDRDEREAEADEQARDWLIDPSALAAFVGRVAPYFSRHEILRFAATQARHPGIVLGRLQCEGLVEYKHLRSLLARVKPFLEGWIDAATPQRVYRGRATADSAA